MKGDTTPGSDQGRQPGRRERYVGFGRELVGEVMDDGAVDAAASVAFWLLLSLPAAILAGLASLSLLGENLTIELKRITFEFVDRVFTSEADELRSAIDDVFDQNNAGLFSFSVLFAVVTVSRGFAGLIRALDVVYDVEESRSFVRLRLASVGLGLGTLATVAVSTVLWAWSRSLGAPTALRLVVALAVLVLWAATIFHVGPNHHTPWRYDLPGAGFCAVGWLLLSVGYGWYVQLAGGGNQIVGVVGALLLGMTWFWLVCLVLLIGGELNEIIADRAGVIGENVAWRARLAELRANGRAAGVDTADPTTPTTPTTTTTATTDDTFHPDHPNHPDDPEDPEEPEQLDR